MEESRKYLVQIVFVLVGIIYLAKLFHLQVMDPTYKSKAEDNIIRRVIEYPYRGVIYDRTGKIIVYNKPVFDLIVVPNEVGEIDTAKLCNLLNIDMEDFRTRMEHAIDYHFQLPSVFMKMLSIEDFAALQIHLVEFPGFYVQARSLRGYSAPAMANALGYIGEISKSMLDRDAENYYRQGDYIGISGIEQSYEKELRGQNGVQFNLVNARGMVKGRFKGGQYDTASVPGQNLVSTIDLELQQYVEWLMADMAGAAVAIEPATGEILCLASSPGYDPAMLSGRRFGENFEQLAQDSLKPLYNRAIMSVYPPGFTFKPIQALIALQEGVLDADETIYVGGGLVGDHAPPGYYTVNRAIQKSSNNYFYIVFRRIINRNLSPNTFIDSRIGLEIWDTYLQRFGLGRSLGIDIPNEKGGMIPTPRYYNSIYGENRWKWSTINSISIGQGEILTSPLQMANYAAAIANRGYFYVPHVIKAIGDSGAPRPEYLQKHNVGIDSVHFETVIDAMENVIKYGTGMRARIQDITVCGKTGTSENPHGEDHSVFIAFAPRENPQIAVSVYVQNAGQGARAAASVAGLMIEKYINGAIERSHIEAYARRGEFIY
jgi:penicillin-binding protein 2